MFITFFFSPLTLTENVYQNSDTETFLKICKQTSEIIIKQVQGLCDRVLKLNF